MGSKALGQRVLAMIAVLAATALPLQAALPGSPAERTPQPPQDAAYQGLVDAANAVVGVKVTALPNARTNDTLGQERTGSGIGIGNDGLVLTIGYLVTEADQIEVTDAPAAPVPAVVVPCDHATGFGRPAALPNSGTQPIQPAASAPLSDL